MRLIVFAIVSAAWLLLTPAPTVAQDSPAPSAAQNPLDALRNKTGLTDEERTSIRSWVQARIAALISDSPGNAYAELRSATANAGTEFRTAFAAACIESARTSYKTAGLRAATQLISLIHSIPDCPLEPAFALLQEALKDERPGVRMAAATGLRDLRPRIAAAGPAVLNVAFSALRDAGKRETSDAVLRIIYQATNYPEVIASPPEPKSNALALLEVLESRSALYDAGSTQTEGADAAGLRAIGQPGPTGAAALFTALDEAERRRLIVAAGKLLQHAVKRYVHGPQPLIDVRTKTRNPQIAEQRDRVELLIEECERHLSEWLQFKPPPAVFDRIRRGRNATEIVIELNKWADKIKETANVDLHLNAPGGDDGD